MDSLTQIVLGAATAEAVAGKKLGNKAVLIGAIAGTIPDLDVLASPFLNTVNQLTFHRSFSHSLLFTVFGSWFFAYLFWKLFKWKSIVFKDLYYVFSLCFLTHILLDTFTTWGTQLLWPFTNYGYALYSVFVVDPFYTIPFLITLIWLMFLNRLHPIRRKLNWIGITLSTCYLILGLLLQYEAKQVFEKNLSTQNISYDKIITKTTPFNIILWSCSVKTKNGYYTGFYSFLDKNDTITFNFEPSNISLLEPYKDFEDVKKLINVTKDFYTLKAYKNDVVLNDLRFGKFNGWQGSNKGEYVFKYHIKQKNNKITITKINYRKPINKSYLLAFFNRVIGEKYNFN